MKIYTKQGWEIFKSEAADLDDVEVGDEFYDRDGRKWAVCAIENFPGSGMQLAVEESISFKDTNPKDAVGVAKAPMSTVPTPFLYQLGLAMMEGARKYGRHNYRATGVRYSVYFDAAKRHLDAWWEGEDIDTDSGLPHPVKAAACMAILSDAILRQNGTDDRPPKSPDGWMREVNTKAKELLAKFPDPVEPHTEL